MVQPLQRVQDGQDPTVGDPNFQGAVALKSKEPAEPDKEDKKPEANDPGQKASYDQHATEDLINEGGIDIAAVDEPGSKSHKVLERAVNGENENETPFTSRASVDDDPKPESDEPKSESKNPPKEEPKDEDRGHLYGAPTEDTKRPKDDKRDANTIIQESPLLANLNDKHKDWLKNGWGDDTPFEGIGDYEKDADAAYRAVEILEHIENFDEDGARITDAKLKDDEVNNGKLDGFFGDGEANPGTEAGRFQDFTKFGWERLKGGEELVPDEPPTHDEKRPEGDTRDAQTIIDENPLLGSLNDQELKDKLKEKVGNFEKDADAAWRADRVLDYIEHFGPDGKIGNEDNTIGNYRIDGFFEGDGLEANPLTESARLQDFLKEESPEAAFEYLNTFDKRTESVNDPKAPKNELDLSNPPTDPVEFSKWLRDKAQQKSVQDVPDFDRTEMVQDPNKFTPEQRAKAVWELQRGLDLYTAGVRDNNEQFSLYEGKGEFNTNPEEFIKSVYGFIDRIGSNPDVQQWQSENEQKAAQDILKEKPELKAKTEEALKEMTEKATGFDAMFEDKDAGGFTALAMYSSQVDLLNKALGNETAPPQINLEGSKHKDEIDQFINNDFGNPNRLKDLMKGVDGKPGMKLEEAVAWLSSRAQTYAYFVGPESVDMMQGSLTGMALDAGLDIFDNGGGEDLILDDKGNIDEQKLKDYFTQLDEQGSLPEQNTNIWDNIVEVVKDGWDLAKASGYVDLGQWLKDLTRFETLTTNPDGSPRVGPLTQADSAWIDEMKATGAFTDKSGQTQPQLRTMFKYGVPHVLSGAFGAIGLGISAAGGVDEPKEILLTAGATLGIMGNGIEAYERNARLFGWSLQSPEARGPQMSWIKPEKAPADRPLRPNGWHSASDQLRHYDALRNTSKGFLSGPGGALIGGFMLMEGADRLKHGDKAGAGLYLTAGAINGFAGLNTIVDAGISISDYAKSLGKTGLNYSNLAEDVILKYGKIGRLLSRAIWPVDFALLGYEIFADNKKDQALDKWVGEWRPYFEPYEITGYPGNISPPDEDDKHDALHGS